MYVDKFFLDFMLGKLSQSNQETGSLKKGGKFSVSPEIFLCNIVSYGATRNFAINLAERSNLTAFRRVLPPAERHFCKDS